MLNRVLKAEHCWTAAPVGARGEKDAKKGQGGEVIEVARLGQGGRSKRGRRRESASRRSAVCLFFIRFCVYQVWYVMSTNINY